MNREHSDVVIQLNHVADQLLSGKRKIKIDLSAANDIEDEDLKSLARKIANIAEQYNGCSDFIVDLSYGRLYTEPPRMNCFTNPFKQLHSELRHLTWQIQQIADGDYNQCVSFSGDFSDAINKMIAALRDRQTLSQQIREDENLFHSIFNTSPDGIVLCNMDHCIINASNIAYNMLRVTDGINGKKNFGDLVHEEDGKCYKWLFEALLNGESKTVTAELRLIFPDGTSFWSELNASMLLDSNCKPKGYIIILRDISERKAAEAQLLQYTDELDEANRTKDKLFSIIAHDLKSYFNPLLGFSNMLVQETGKKSPDAERIAKFSKILRLSASKAYDLLINMLEWSRLQSDRIVIKPELFDLSHLVNEIVESKQVIAISKNITLNCTPPDNLPIISDRAIINTILRNLIDNAIKYTPQNKPITVSLTQEGNTCLISVKDSGAGIPADSLETIFQIGTESMPGTDGEKGTGLGLILCRDFVNKIGGNIWAESLYGNGATFIFSLKNLS